MNQQIVNDTIQEIQHKLDILTHIGVKPVVRLGYIMPDGTMKYLTINGKHSWQSVGGAKLAFQAEYGYLFKKRYTSVHSNIGWKDLEKAVADFWKEFWQKKIVKLILA